jgi:hypothetical protein
MRQVHQPKILHTEYKICAFFATSWTEGMAFSKTFKREYDWLILRFLSFPGLSMISHKMLFKDQVDPNSIYDKHSCTMGSARQTFGYSQKGYEAVQKNMHWRRWNRGIFGNL